MRQQTGEQAIRDFVAQTLINEPRGDFTTVIGDWIRQAGRQPTDNEFVAIRRAFERRTGAKFRVAHDTRDLLFGMAFVALVHLAPAIPYVSDALASGGSAELVARIARDGMNVFSALPLELAAGLAVVSLLLRRPGIAVGLVIGCGVTLLVWPVAAYFSPNPPWAILQRGGPVFFR